MRKIRYSAVVALLLIVCIFITSCDFLAGLDLPDLGDLLGKPSNGNDNTGNDNTCTHATTVIQGQKDATCQEKGYTGDTVCTACTKVIIPGTETPMLDHTYDKGKVTKEPTCIETGVTTYTCSGCGAIKTEVISTVEHDDSYHDAWDGTHIHTCSKCTLNETEEHNPKDAGKKYPASCTEPAYTEHTCVDCGGVYKVYDENSTALGHDFNDWATVSESTCMESGLKAQRCMRDGCGHVNEVEIPSSGVHSFVFSHYSPAPTCVDAGWACYTCEWCGMPEEKEVSATGVHNYMPLESADDGWVRKECSYCYNITSSFDASTLKVADLKTEAIDKETDLEMNMETAAIQFPQNVVSQITSGSDVSVSADVLKDEDKSAAIDNIEDEESKALLENAPIYDFTVKVDNEVFTDNFDTKVAITVSYDNGDNDADGIVIYYLAEDGTIETITDVVYIAETKEVTFFVSHFSFYAVAYKETQEMRCKRGLHEYVKTDYTVEATCFNFGYTLYECSCCHRTTVDDIVERKEHNYGDIIPASPTCERGDYVRRICQNDGCGSILEIKFVGATGHDVDAPASCETSSTCTKCGKVLSRPLGHRWTEWEVVVEPSEITSGLRRRYCLTCGKVDEATLASTGNIEAIEYDTYLDLINLILGDLLGIKSGTLEFVVEDTDNIIDVSAKIMKTEKGYRIILSGSQTRFDDKYENEIRWIENFEFYYDNGVFVALNYDDNDDDDDTYGASSDLHNLVPVPLEVYKAIAEDIHSQLDDFVRLYLDQTRAIIDEYSALFADDIDAILSDAGINYTVDQIDDLIDSIETVYAYISLKLGYTTTQEVKNEIVMPSTEDFKAVLSAIMAVSEENGITTYSLASGPIVEAAYTILDYADEHAEDTIATFVYSVIKDKALEFDAGLVDFNAIVDLIAEQFPGTLTVSDAVDMYIEFSEETGFISLTDVYSLIDQFMLEIYHEEFDSEQFVKDNGKLCLDDVAAQIAGEGAKMADIYAAVKDYAAELKVGALRPDGQHTIAEYAERFRMMLDMIDLNSDFSFSIDEEGRLTALNVNHEFFVSNGSEERKINGAKIAVVHDENIVVEIPEAIESMMIAPNAYYDAQGNLVVEGIGNDLDCELGIFGNASVNISDMLSKDDALTSELGAGVYVLKPEYWTSSNWVGSYFLYNGNYYDTSSYGYEYYAEVENTVSIEDIAEQIRNNLNKNDYPIGYLAGSDDIFVYQVYANIAYANDYYYGSSSLGIAYKIDGEWKISTQYGRVNNSDKEMTEYYVSGACDLDTFLSSLTIGSTKEYDHYGNKSYINDNDGRYTPLVVNLTYEGAGSSIQVLGYVKNDEVMFVGDYEGWYSESYYKLDTPVEIPEYDREESYTRTIRVIDDNGNFSTVDVKSIYLHEYVPTYYVKIADGLYANMDSSYVRSVYSTTGKDTLSLPDGNVLYINGRTYDNTYGYKYGYETVYGYAETKDGWYIQTAVIMNGEEMIEVLYREASATKNVNLNYVYDIDEYTTRTSDGTYKVSAELINKLKAMSSDINFAIQIDAEYKIGDIRMNYMYYVGAYCGYIPEVDLGTIGGTARPDNYEFWRDLFENGYGEGEKPDVERPNYTVKKNDDGSITLIFSDGTEINNLYYNNLSIPVEDMLEYNEQISEDTGLNIYTYTGTYVPSRYSSYVYKNGKYYEYWIDWDNNFDYTFADSTDALINTGWHISDMWYRFDTIGAEGLPEKLRVYESTIIMNWRSYNHSYADFTAYTFFIDGVLNIAVDAEVTGESLLTFESFMPLDEYMDSLEYVFGDGYEDDYYTVYYNGEKIKVYSQPVYVYETDGQGNRIGGSYKYSYYVEYILDNGAKKYITSYSYLDDIRTMITSDTPSDISHIPADAIRTESKESCSNGVFDIVQFDWKEETTYSVNFIKLAGRFYRYDCYYWNGYNCCYNEAKLSEWEFENQALDKVWYFMVVDHQTGEETYYTEFIPSDKGFTPSGDIVSAESITGDHYNTTLLGYTPDGDELYEVAYYINDTADGFEYTVEEQDDGTVFYHKDGIGYLKVTENYETYYVKARKVATNDGGSEIYCFIRGAVIASGELHGQTDSAFNSLITIDGNTITISEKLLDAASASGKNYFCFEISSNYNYFTFDYYQLESLFMMAE